jgi:YD repeat-containing protein
VLTYQATSETQKVVDSVVIYGVASKPQSVLDQTGTPVEFVYDQARLRVSVTGLNVALQGTSSAVKVITVNMS